MTDRSDLHDLKTLAKRYARANRIPHHKALDLVATAIGFPHWKAAANAAKGDWRPSPEQLADVEALVRGTIPALRTDHEPNLVLGDEGPEEGAIGAHPYWIEESLDEVHVYGRGWHIMIGEAPSAEPVIEVSDRRFKSNPIQDPEFVKEVLEIGQARARRVRARISSDWPRRSTKPDADGRARHPLSEDLSKDWFCLHCDGKFTGTEMAKNMWHCPSCSATPIDIFSSPFWLGVESE